uniref:Uncharacterized protein n=1 Tax=Romanomermis culicivorax TaxID=13658 RepID=A0A915IZL1_ROMCU
MAHNIIVRLMIYYCIFRISDGNPFTNVTRYLSEYDQVIEQSDDMRLAENGYSSDEQEETSPKLCMLQERDYF